MQHVASKSNVHQSQHHAVEPRGRAPAGEPKQPTTPFSLLLGGAEDAPPPRPKQQDDVTKPPSRAAASEASRSDQTQQHPEHEPEAKAAGDAKVTPDETGKTGEKPAEAVVATSPEDDETKTADTDKTAAIVAPAAPPPVQQAAAAVVAVLPTTQSAPTEPNDDDTADAADLAKAAAAAGLKAEQPAPAKGAADQKAPTAPSGADDSQPVAAAPADAGKTAPLEAPKPQEEVHAPSATPDQDKPEHARVHEAASRGEVRSTDELANPQTTTHVADSAPAGKQADGTQVVNVQHQADRTGATAAPAAAGPNNAPAAVPLAGLALEIAARAQSGRNHFEIRLDPPELGRIHVHLDVDKSGQVTSRLVVDRAETLDALRRDAADLERALQQAGLKTGDSGLQFTLRDQSFAGRDDNSTPANAARLVVPDADLASVEAAPAGYGRLLRAAGGVDIRV